MRSSMRSTPLLRLLLLMRLRLVLHTPHLFNKHQSPIDPSLSVPV